MVSALTSGARNPREGVLQYIKKERKKERGPSFDPRKEILESKHTFSRVICRDDTR